VSDCEGGFLALRPRICIYPAPSWCAARVWFEYMCTQLLCVDNVLKILCGFDLSAGKEGWIWDFFLLGKCGEGKDGWSVRDEVS
jgi:hypothetical protein